MANRFLNNIRINDEYTLPSQDGTADQIIKTDGSGNLSFVDSSSLLYGADTLDDVTTRGNTTSNSVQVGAVTVTGNLTVDSNILYVDSVGDQVGIGTNNPTALLDVAADAKINSLTIGKGTASVLTNSAFGFDALLSNTTGSENIAGGYEALKSNTSGFSNSAFGHKALKSNLGGFNNTAIGESALILNTSGLNNTAIGQGALYSNASGTNNTASGASSLFSNTIGQRNSAHGQGSLQNNTTGGNNSAYGSASLYNNNTGINNVGVGLSALYYNTSGSRNIGIGREAGYNLTTGSNNTIIGSIPGTAGLSDTVIIGAGTAERLRIDSSGDSTFYGNITVNNDYTLPSVDGTADQVIKTDGAGNLSFVDATSLVTTAESGLVYYEVKNSSGSTINKGKAVMAVGTDGNSGHILIDEMVADGSVEGIYFIGVLETTLDNGDIGRVIHFGELDQFNTLGQNGETWSDGDVLWLDPANDGDFTITEPNGPNYKIAAAIVKSAATNGKIHIRVQNNEGVHDLHDVNLSSLSEGHTLSYDATAQVWKNSGQSTTAALMPAGSTLDRPTPVSGMIRFNTTTSEFEGYNGTEWAPIGGANTASIDIDNFTGDGTTVNFTLTSDIQEEDNTQVYIDGVYQSKSNYTTSGATLTFSTAPPNGTSIEVVNFTGIAESQVDGSGTANYVTKWQDADTLANSVIQDNGTTVTIGNDTIVNGDLTVDTNTLYVDSTNNRVGIGTISPARTLEVNSGVSSDVAKIGNNSGAFTFGYTSSLASIDLAASNAFRIRQGAVIPFYIKTDGNVGINNTSPNSPLQFNNSAETRKITLYEVANNNYQFYGFGVESNTLVYSVGDLGDRHVFFAGSGASTRKELMRIDGSGDISFRDTSANEAFYWDASTARLSIGAGSSPARVLHTSGDLVRFDNTGASAILLLDTTNSEGFRIVTNVDNTGCFSIEDMGTATGGAGTERLRIDSSGNVGIGTTSPNVAGFPDATLTIEGGSGSYGAFEIGSLSATASGDRLGEIRFYNKGTTAPYGLTGIRGLRGTNANDSQLSFWTSSGNSAAERMRISSGGNVGIGTTSPASQIHNNGTTLLGTGTWPTASVGNNGGRVAMLSNTEDQTVIIANTQSTVAANRGARLMLGATATAGTANISAAEIFGGKQNSTSGDFSSYLQLRTASSNGSIGTRLHITSGGSVGIGTDSPNTTLHIADPSSASTTFRISAQSNDENYAFIRHTDYTFNTSRLDFGTTYGYSTEVPAMSIFNGNVGIGTTSPVSLSGQTSLTIDGSNYARLDLHTNGTQYGYLYGGSGYVALGSQSSSTNGLLFETNGSERMRITSGGQVSISANGSVSSSADLTILRDFGGGTAIAIESTNTSNTAYVGQRFILNGLLSGYIVVTSTGTSYNSASDYRLKENVVELTGALDRVDALKPSRFNFIADPTKTVDGFLAHEVADVVPEAISGTKDEVDDEGNPVYQGIDQSKLVPLLVGAIQELRAEIETLKSQINP